MPFSQQGSDVFADLRYGEIFFDIANDRRYDTNVKRKTAAQPAPTQREVRCMEELIEPSIAYSLIG
jgi:hypothetical protein